MTHSTIREPHGPEGNRGAKFRVILSFENLRTPRKIEGRRIEG